MDNKYSTVEAFTCELTKNKKATKKMTQMDFLRSYT